MNRIDNRFKELRKNKKKAFIAFVTAGFPSLSVTKELIIAFDKIGVDIIELGVPFSDPMADGPVIQEASQEALKNKVHLQDILKMVKGLRKKVSLPICLMTYYNPIFCFGDNKFIAQAKKSGVDAVIIPDLAFEEAGDFTKNCNKAGIRNIYFISPTTSLKRIRLIASKAQGFIYYVSLTGVTGMRKNLPLDLKQNIRVIKKYTTKPVCVGFGLSSPSQVRNVARIADGVIVGSAIVKKIKEYKTRPDLVRQVTNFANSLKSNV